MSEGFSGEGNDRYLEARVELPEPTAKDRVEVVDEPLETPQEISAEQVATDQNSPEHSRSEQVETLSKEIFEYYQNYVNTVKDGLLKQLGDEASEVSIYDAIDKQLSKSAREKLSAALISIDQTKEINPQSKDQLPMTLDIAQRVSRDMYGGGNWYYDNKPEATDIDFSKWLIHDFQLDKKSFAIDPSQKTDIVRAVGLCLQSAIHKSGEWGQYGQSKSVVELIDNLVKNNPDTLKSADFSIDDLKHAVINELASNGADLQSKPNYEHAQPERKSYAKSGIKILTEIANLEAEEATPRQ